MLWGDRSGREPRSARSPLRLRRIVALVGAIVCAGSGVLLLALGVPIAPTMLLFAPAVIGVVDAVVITRRLRRLAR